MHENGSGRGIPVIATDTTVFAAEVFAAEVFAAEVFDARTHRHARIDTSADGDVAVVSVSSPLRLRSGPLPASLSTRSKHRAHRAHRAHRGQRR